MSKKLKLFITLSVMLNLLLVGMMLGHLFRSVDPRSPDLIIRAVDQSSLPQNTKDKYKNLFQAQDNGDALRADAQRLREAQYMLLKSPTFDRKAYLDLSRELSDVYGSRRVKMTQNIADLAAEMNQADRVRLADSLQKMSARWKAARGEGKRN